LQVPLETEVLAFTPFSMATMPGDDETMDLLTDVPDDFQSRPIDLSIELEGLRSRNRSEDS
jgi:hypothetical protein